MGGKVEKIYLKYFDISKMRGKVGTLIRDEMNRLYVLHYYRLKEHHRKQKSVRRDKYSVLPQIRKLFQNIWNFILQTLIHFVLLFAVICLIKKCLNIIAFTKTILLTPSLTLANNSNMFFAFFTLFFFSFFSKLNFSEILGEQNYAYFL